METQIKFYQWRSTREARLDPPSPFFSYPFGELKKPCFVCFAEISENTKEMKIEVKCSCGEGDCPEWAIVELQGVVEVQPEYQHRLQNLEIGRLCRPSDQEIYNFTVGYHELTGSKVALKKPLLVLKKVKHSESDKSANPKSPGVELDVIGVIRHKILFKTRPKALISKAQPAVREKASASASAASNQ